jgi:hypothetical protein
MVVFAITAVALLATIGALYSFGAVLSQRRGLQTAADAASLSGSWQVLSQLQSDDRSDAAVLDAITRFARDNGLPSDGTPTNATYLAADYLDAAGTSIGRVGVDSMRVPSAARGVRVSVSNAVPTVLPGFVQLTQVLVRTSASAVARPAASVETEMRALPVAVRLDDVRSAYAAHTELDVFGSNSRVLDLRDAGAPGFGSWPERLQFWSDGQDDNGTVRTSMSLRLAAEPRLDAVAAGLRDNVRRQALRDTGGADYALVMVPVWDSESGGSVRIAGFAMVKLRSADIGATSTRGLVVPYAAGAWAARPTTGAPSDVGAVLIGLVG